jgi:hypothetical protein
MDSQHLPPLVGTIGLLGSLTISEVNGIVAIAVGILTLIYLAIRIIKEIKNNE